MVWEQLQTELSTI